MTDPTPDPIERLREAVQAATVRSYTTRENHDLLRAAEAVLALPREDVGLLMRYKRERDEARKDRDVIGRLPEVSDRADRDGFTVLAAVNKLCLDYRLLAQQREDIGALRRERDAMKNAANLMTHERDDWKARAEKAEAASERNADEFTDADAKIIRLRITVQEQACLIACLLTEAEARK